MAELKKMEDTTKPGQLPPLRSEYNFFIERNNGFMVFNARKGSFTFVSESVGLELQKNTPLERLTGEVILIEAGILHKGDEFEHIIKLYHNGTSNNSTLSIALVPTLSCNLRCGYCYQSEYRNERRMSLEVQTLAMDYIRSKLKQGWQEIDCTWYGGEPLLEKEMIYELSAKLRQIAKEEGRLLLPMKIVTNGSLLDEETAEKLAHSGVSLVQISLDSLIDDEHSLRGALSHEGALSTITKNIISALNYLNIQIRINVSKTNQNEIYEILQVLKDLNISHLVSLERVTDLEAEAGATVDNQGNRQPLSDLETSKLIFPLAPKEPETLSRKAFAKIESNLMFHDPSHISKIVRKLTPKTKFCGATAGNLFVIDPDGNISRCWHSAGSRSESVGNLRWEQASENQTNNNKWDGISPFLYSSCSSCKVLPLCMGGCSHPRLFMDSKLSPCESIKYQIQACVDAIGSHLEIPGTSYP